MKKDDDKSNENWEVYEPDDQKGFTYQQIADMAEEKRAEKKKTDPRSKKASKNNNVNKRTKKSGDKGHSTRAKNKSVKVDRSKINEATLLHEFMEWKSLGLSDEICASYVDINKQTIVNWKARAVKAIEECDEQGIMYDEHEDYHYIKFKKMYDGTRKAIVANGMNALQKLMHDVVIYQTDEDGNPLYDPDTGEKIVAKIARPGNVAAIERAMKLADPENFDNKQTIDINQTNENRVVMITQGINLPRNENGEIDKKQLEDMKQDFLSELSSQNKGLTQFIENRSQEEDDDN